MNTKHWLVLAGFVLVSQVAGIIGSIFTSPAIPGWYATLVRPELAPPNWIFGPVWITLYFLMGLAAFIVWRRGLERREVRLALGVFAIQLALNALWSIIFFGLNNLGLALAEIVVLWLAILVTIITFARVSRLAAWLLLPYILWVSFATYLNYAFYILN